MNKISEIKDNLSKKLESSIEFLDRFSYLPFLILSIVFFIFFLQIIVIPFYWKNILSFFFLGSIIGYLLYYYYNQKISPKINSKKYDEVFLDSFCLGVVACMFYGTGVIILIESIFILIYSYIQISSNSKEKTNKEIIEIEELKLLNSINSFSAIGGFLIILFALHISRLNEIYTFISSLSNSDISIIFKSKTLFLILSLIVITFELNTREIDEYFEFGTNPITMTFIKGILASLYYGAGIFIIFKAIILTFISVNKRENDDDFKLKSYPKMVKYSNR
ncbi:MAG: hypothetical protein ACFFA6_04725 [Promethearchaeota archaeon]